MGFNSGLKGLNNLGITSQRDRLSTMMWYCLSLYMT